MTSAARRATYTINTTTATVSGIHSRSLFGVALGLGVHTVTEGIALGTSMKMGPPHENDVALAGLGVFLAILLHKPLDAYSIVGMMKSAGHGQRARTVRPMSDLPRCALWWP